MFREGVIVVNKPAGWTSQDVCAKLRGRLHVKRIGHTGTLDPMATGVLPICLGRATRIIEYYDLDFKTYRTSMKLGIVTDTLDITGKVLSESSSIDVDEQSIMNCIESFIGEIEQIPPKYSAVRINGKRAYELAREGKDFEIKSRKITIKSIDNIKIDMEKSQLSFDVTCSKGTYIRTLCDDIGKKLGCGAAMTELTRIASGCFNIDNAKSIDEIVEMSDDDINKFIISADVTLVNLGEILVDDNMIIAIKNGNEVFDKYYKITKKTSFENIYKIYSNEVFLGIGKLIDSILKMEKVITFGDI